jgi:hypothetical protein
MNLPSLQKSKYYEDWTRNQEIGGMLVRFIDKGKIRLYIKDTLLKEYGRKRLADQTRPFRVLGLEQPFEVVETYTKPHGRRLKDGRIISWGRAEDWKTILMALHERAYSCKGSKPFGAVLMYADGRFRESDLRQMIEAAAGKLAVHKLIWLDT